jgi:hypothetical protein
MCVCDPRSRTPFCGVGECQWPEVEKNPTTHPYLSKPEIDRLQRVFAKWPQSDWVRGLQEEVADIIAARELAALPPLTLNDIEVINYKLRRAGLDPLELTDQELEHVSGGKVLTPYFPRLQAAVYRASIRAVQRQTVKGAGIGK